MSAPTRKSALSHPLAPDARDVDRERGVSHRVQLSTRILPETLKRAKLHAVNADMDLQDVVEDALREYLARH